jgi:hypothetical protein
MGVLAAGKQGVEVLEEAGEVAVGVVDACVIVVGHGDDEEDFDLGAPCGEGEAIDEGVVGVVIRSQEEAPLGTAAGDHVVGPWEYLAWKAHARVIGWGPEELPATTLGRGSGIVHDEDGRALFRIDAPMHDSLTSLLGQVTTLLCTALGRR